jgi:hypothetical protein
VLLRARLVDLVRKDAFLVGRDKLLGLDPLGSVDGGSNTRTLTRSRVGGGWWTSISSRLWMKGEKGERDLPNSSVWDEHCDLGAGYDKLYQLSQVLSTRLVAESGKGGNSPAGMKEEVRSETEKF